MRSTRPGGLITVHNVHGRANVFDSEIAHNHTIRLKICRATRKRDLYRHWHHPQEVIVEVEMSYAQYATLISTPNSGVGSPCTVRFVKGEGQTPPVPVEKKTRDHFAADVLGKRAEILAQLSGLHRYCQGLKLSAAAQRGLLLQVEMVRQDIEKNLPFLLASFQAAMDDLVAASKADFEAWVTQAAWAGYREGTTYRLEIDNFGNVRSAKR